MSLADQMRELGTQLAERESAHSDEMGRAHARSRELHARVQAGLDGFHQGCRDAGASQLVVALSPPRIDDKHLHSVQFDVTRGRYCMIVTVKSKGEVTLVGPFKAGKQEGPCRSIPLDDDPEIDLGISEVMAEFLAQAFTP